MRVRQNIVAMNFAEFQYLEEQVALLLQALHRGVKPGETCIVEFHNLSHSKSVAIEAVASGYMYSHARINPPDGATLTQWRAIVFLRVYNLMLVGARFLVQDPLPDWGPLEDKGPIVLSLKRMG